MGILKDLASLLPLLPLFLRPGRMRPSAVYDMLSTHNVLGEKSLFLNLGYWEGGERTYDEACAKLAKLLAETADLKPGHDLLDVGFGFADQDMYWSEVFSPRRIVGLNITRSQVEKARQRVRERGLSGKIELLNGSATAMPLADETFDRVTALETAFHYDTRADFFKEAFRVLRPGGRIATADIIPLPREGFDFKLSVGMYLARSFWQIPAVNMYDRETYREKLGEAGFKDVAIRSIRGKVYAPLVDFLKTHLYRPEIERRIDPLILAGFRRSVRAASSWDSFDYILATGEKMPAGPHDRPA